VTRARHGDRSVESHGKQQPARSDRRNRALSVDGQTVRTLSGFVANLTSSRPYRRHRPRARDSSAMENDDDLDPEWDEEDLPEIARQVEALCSIFGEHFVAYVLGYDVVPDKRGDRLSDTEEFRMMAAGFTDAAPNESEVIAELSALAQEVASSASAYWRGTRIADEFCATTPTPRRRSPRACGSIASATRSRTCSAGSRTGGASQPATIDAPIPSSQPSASPQPSHSGFEQRVLSLAR
jgi:hypothetical protein